MCEACIETYQNIMANKPNILVEIEKFREQANELANKLMPLGREIMNIQPVNGKTGEFMTLAEIPDDVPQKKDLLTAEKYIGLIYLMSFLFSESVSTEFYGEFFTSFCTVCTEGYENGHAAMYYASQQVKN